ncbi:Uncharacterized protein OBRU01_18717 [Operophtera brumata]|uniref:Interference hedgehog n=1 Tax=Operophtera brumata TaxID=104452 RepID=A0A0L7KY84_OPEBR|nr:Uncharacterized protein OBRU01_18717 [Operophtera brumata]
MAALQVHLLLATVSAIYAAELDMRFLKDPESVTAPVGDKVTFECEVNVPAEWLVWRGRADDGAEWADVLKSADVDVHTTNTSIILVSVPARLRIARIDASKNTQKMRVVTAPLHNSVALHCKEPASEPPAVLTWWKETSRGSKKQLDMPHGVLVIHNATSEDSGTYGCKATNDLSTQAIDLLETIYLKVQKENKNDVRFLETEEYVGSMDSEGVLTVAVKLNGVLRLWCGAVGSPPPRATWTREGRVIALQPPSWDGIMRNLTASENGNVHLPCGTPHGQPPPEVYWCFACNSLGCAYDASLLTVVPLQISVKVQYKEVSNSSNVQWNTATHEVPMHIHSLAIDGLAPDKYYKFRVAAVYSNQDNKQGKSSAKFYLQRGGALQKPQPPTLKQIAPMSPYSLQLEWTWSSGPHNISAGGFYVYYRSVSTAADYEKVSARAEARALALDHLMPDTAYEVKMQAYTQQAPSDFSSILVAKTQRSPAGSSTSEAPPSDVSESRRPDALVTAGGAIGAAALLLILAVTLLLCRRAKRVPADKEKGSVPETVGNNGYIPANAKVPITITTNPMHSEVRTSNS